LGPFLAPVFSCRKYMRTPHSLKGVRSFPNFASVVGPAKFVSLPFDKLESCIMPLSATFSSRLRITPCVHPICIQFVYMYIYSSTLDVDVVVMHGKADATGSTRSYAVVPKLDLSSGRERNDWQCAAGADEGYESHSIKGRRALITGASREVGRAIAAALVDTGAEVAINYRRGEEPVGDVERYVKDMGVGDDIQVFPADLNDLVQANGMKRQVSRHFGKIDILVNVGGIEFRTHGKERKGVAWSIPETVRLAGLRNCIRLYMEDLLASEHGRIINITPLARDNGARSPAKGGDPENGVLQMTVSLARDLAAGNVTVNAIATGFMEPGKAAGMPPAIRKTILALVPNGRFGQPEELAWAIAFLASVNSSYLTGQVLRFAGGETP
jgi:3-oxoacyl-[acyl-carrier protein] reductase